VKIAELELMNFRGYDQAKISFGPGLNLLYGDNAQGKTNLIEAVYVCATGKSFRTTHDRELIRRVGDQREPNGFRVQSRVTSKSGDLRLTVEYAPKTGKIISLNGFPIAKRSELLGYLTVVVFTPEDLNIIKGGPSHRRRFIDFELAQINPAFRNNLIDYGKVLRQRNNLLRQMAEENLSGDLKEVFDTQLAEIASKLIVKRVFALQQIARYAQELHRSITEERESLTLEYVASYPLYQNKRSWFLDGTLTLNEEEVRESLLNYLKSKTKEEIYRGISLYGPHRDDLNLLINSSEIRTYGSQGQQRTATLALKLAELEYMRQETGEYPVLLLDDVLSELDASRRKFLLDTVKEQVQTLVTATETGYFHPTHLAGARIYEVREGRITARAKH